VVPTQQIPENMFTTTDAAQRFNKDESRIRKLCIDNDLGELKYGRIRLLRLRDLTWLEKYFQANGRNRKKSTAG
jgi:hypothetical protein